MNVNHTMSPVRKAVLGLLAPLIYTSSVMATENTVESTPDVGVTPYIVNGSNASVTDFPSMASLFIDRIEYDGVYSTGPYCGATILDPTHILTAAHCIYGDENAQLFTVVVPQLEDTSQFPNNIAQKARVSEVYYRSDYSNALSDLLRNDVAILKLESALNIDSINDIVQRPSDETYRNVANDFVAVGHGDTRTGFDGTTLLQQANLNYVDNATCKTVFAAGNELTENQICFVGDVGAFGLYGGTCQGDSGGPVYWKDGSIYRQVGITSFGPETCGGSSRVTSVFTEIFDYKDWIDSVIAGTETAKFISTDAKRSASAGTSASTGSGSSGGSVSFGLLGMLMLIASVRKAVKR
ncbi:serine protease [Vibrio crassostreae]|uniref:S1 family peptidase n=1 Tax=Vibrio crassostreae TaxID=246167 RepID=UPI000F467B99|nr:serine protease [Vibrio crassostreae]NOI52055.1 serine protease [Vibrio crassostreae]ROR19995.1 secreted trypsin-like serine protease [Vibrio crassostreae]TCN82927.1 secreted trypsin-like serine protease [Vibrio crassostreae]CAK2147846.1 Secreted trypsin-like serine protease [Vibrio crassostreae]CAK2363784.1 Secreted trypsin-like serine protease [Vibrio crassostreae]